LLTLAVLNSLFLSKKIAFIPTKITNFNQSVIL
jgi:hypothetical protein